MIAPIVYAFFAGVLIGLSRQLNGRLSLSTTPLISSFWNHIVGFALLCAAGLILGGLLLPGWENTPWYAYLGGPVGVIFVASGSWLVARIGATNTALLVIGGQMASGVIIDFLRGAPMTLWASALGVVLIIAGAALTQRR